MKHIHHIVPKHMGGGDEPENLIEMTIEEHAAAHKTLYEQHGYWQDFLAWQGLAGLMTKEDIVFTMLSEAGKKGIQARPNGNTGIKYDTTRIVEAGERKGAKNPCARTYLVHLPDGTTEIVKSLKTWCEAHELSYGNVHTLCVRRGMTHKGYRVDRR